MTPIPASLTKKCLADLVPAIANIVNVSLFIGAVPNQFKQAVGTSLLKKSRLDRNNPKHYRPVSNVSFVSKILEKTVLRQLQKYLFDNGLLYMHQSAYWKDHSTEMAVLSVRNGLLVKVDEKACLTGCLVGPRCNHQYA